MFSRQFHHLCTAFILILTCSATAVGQWDGPDYAGAWMVVGDGRRAKLNLNQDESQLWGAFESANGLQVWEVRGEIKSGGRIEMIRYIPINELGGVPEPALSSVFEQYGADDRFGFFVGHVVLDPTTEGLSGYYTRINAAWYTDSGALHEATEINTDVLLIPATHLPDLKVENLNVAAKEGGPSGTYWEVSAEIVNGGGAAPTGPTKLVLERTARVVKGQRPDWEPVPFSPMTIPAPGPGQRTKVSWSEIQPVQGAPQPVRLDASDAALQLHIDPDDTFDEQSKANNVGQLDRIQCDESDGMSPPRREVSWIAPSEGGSTPTSDAAAAPLAPYEGLFDGMGDEAKAVLCYIKMEARRRAGQHNRSVIGTHFFNELSTYFLKPYLDAPNPATGLFVLSELGASQGAPRIGLGASIYIPEGLRNRHSGGPSIPAWIYPATHFFTSGSFKGFHVDRMPYLDVPFLVGEPNMSQEENADFVGGGKNLSNVMHWATGAKYWEIPEPAFRELFIGYEYWHMEGIDVFGEDAINDLIGEMAGHMMGKRIIRADIRSVSDLGRKLDTDFYRARAWVGALLRENQEHFDELILQELKPRSDYWLTGQMIVMEPWSGDTGGNTVQHMLVNGMSAKEVAATRQVEKLVEIYTLIFEATEWEKANGSVGLSSVERKVMSDTYNDQFRRAPKDWGDEWDWRP